MKRQPFKRKRTGLSVLMFLVSVSAFADASSDIASKIESVINVFTGDVFKAIVFAAVVLSGIMLVVNKDSETGKKKFAMIFIGSVVVMAAQNIADMALA